jgi:hypothetical protein
VLAEIRGADGESCAGERPGGGAQAPSATTPATMTTMTTPTGAAKRILYETHRARRGFTYVGPTHLESAVSASPLVT